MEKQNSCSSQRIQYPRFKQSWHKQQVLERNARFTFLHSNLWHKNCKDEGNVILFQPQLLYNKCIGNKIVKISLPQVSYFKCMKKYEGKTSVKYFFLQIKLKVSERCLKDKNLGLIQTIIQIYFAYTSIKHIWIVIFHSALD